MDTEQQGSGATTAQNGGGQSNQTNGAGGAPLTQAKEALHGLEAYLAPLFANLPHLPAGGRKFIVDVAPWVVLIFGLLGVFALLTAGGVSTFFAIATFGMGIPVLLHMLIALLGAVLLLMSYPGIKAHSKKGWNLVFYSQVVSIVGGVFSLFGGYAYGSNLFGVVIGAFIGFYILFEVRESYK